MTVLTGIGGQGKGQPALRFCHLAREYDAKFWANATSEGATSEGTTKQSYENIASVLSRKTQSRNSATAGNDEAAGRELTSEMVTKKLFRWKKPWLLVLDNYDDPDHFPQSRAVTSRIFSRLAEIFRIR